MAVTRPDATTTHSHAHLQADVQNPCSWDEADTPTSYGGLRPGLLPTATRNRVQ